MKDAKWIVFKNQHEVERARISVDGYMQGEINATKELIEYEYHGDKITATVE
ncbi:MAG: hypothetical protein PHX21_05840 [bacterium]|nr:hypothetical protein [bacterium]